MHASRIFIITTFVIVVGIGSWMWWNDRGSDVRSSASQNNNDSQVVVPLQRASLEAVGIFSGTGVAIRDYSDSAFYLEVETTLKDVGDGLYYKGWIVRDNPFDLVSLGELQRDFKNSYSARFETIVDYSDHPFIVVTLEKRDSALEGVPGEHVLEGSFSQP